MIGLKQKILNETLWNTVRHIYMMIKDTETSLSDVQVKVMDLKTTNDAVMHDQ